MVGTPVLAVLPDGLRVCYTVRQNSFWELQAVSLKPVSFRDRLLLTTRNKEFPP
jgi:hypothetical protein